MMLSRLVYSYATGRFSSREIEQATYYDVGVRYICGGDKHPDHDTICSFRVKNKKAFKEAFVKVLLLAQELGQLKKIGGVSVDGTKVKANASKHSAVSYKRAGEMIQALEREIEELTQKADEADSAAVDTGLTIPDEIARREDRKASLQKARGVIEARYEEVKKQEQEGYDANKKARADEEKRSGKKPRGRTPKPPSKEPPEKAQAAVDTEGSMLILGRYVTSCRILQ
jgi:hypothetical protein